MRHERMRRERMWPGRMRQGRFGFAAVHSIWPPLAAVLLFLLAWEVIYRAGWYSPGMFPGPSVVIAVFIDSWPILWMHTASTSLVIFTGFVIGVSIGLLLAVVLHFSRLLRSAFTPLLVLSQNVPVIVLAPLLAIWFGFGWLPKMIVLTLVCFFPVAISTLDGLSRADRSMLTYMHMSGAGRWQIFTKLELPWSLPSVFSGLKVSATYSVLGAVVAEWSGASKGLGYYLFLSKSGFQVAHMFAAIVIIVGLSMLMFGLMVLAEKWLIRWHSSTR